jgi:hypothetical protein
MRVAARGIQGSAVPADDIAVLTDACATSHVVASALGHSSPAVTHAHYIDGATARRARTRRVVGKVAPEPALRVVEDEPATAITAATRPPRKPARRGSGMAAKPALQGGRSPRAEHHHDPGRIH